MRKPEPKYFQVQDGTRTSAEACLHPELTCVDSFLDDFYNHAVEGYMFIVQQDTTNEHFQKYHKFLL